MAQRRREQAALSARSLLAALAFEVLCGAPLAAGMDVPLTQPASNQQKMLTKHTQADCVVHKVPSVAASLVAGVHMLSSLIEAVMCAGWPSLDAGSQLPSTSNSATLREGFDMIAADPVDPQVCVGRVRVLSGLANAKARANSFLGLQRLCRQLRPPPSQHSALSAMTLS